MKKIQKSFLMPLLFCMAMFYIGCGGGTDNPSSSSVDLYGTKWIGTNPGGFPVALEFDSYQTDSTSNSTLGEVEGSVYLTFSHDNTRQNYTYDYEYDDTNARWRWMIRNGSDVDIIHFYIADANTLVVDKFFTHGEQIFKKIGTAANSTSFTSLDGTTWGGLNPVGRPMLYSFGKTRVNHTYSHLTPDDRAVNLTDAANKVMVTFAFDGTSTGYDLNPVYDSTTKKGRISSTGGDTGGPGAFTVSNNYSEITFDQFYSHPGLKIYRIK